MGASSPGTEDKPLLVVPRLRLAYQEPHLGPPIAVPFVVEQLEAGRLRRQAGAPPWPGAFSRAEAACSCILKGPRAGVSRELGVLYGCWTNAEREERRPVGRNRFPVPIKFGYYLPMESSAAAAAPGGHTPDGGVLVGNEGARRRLVLFEDPQCPYCRQFEEVSGDLLRREVAAGAVAVEYRMRCFLGVESVRADNALALAAESGRFDQLRRELFANQPAENTGGFTVADLVDLGYRAGLTTPDYEQGVRDGRFERWVIETDREFEDQDPQGTPAALLDGHPVESHLLFDPGALGALIRG